MKKFVFRVRQIDDGCDIIRYDRIQKAEFSVSAARLVLKFSSHDIRNDDVIWDSCEDGGARWSRIMTRYGMLRCINQTDK